MVSQLTYGLTTGSTMIQLHLGSLTSISQRKTVADIMVDNRSHIPRRLTTERQEFLSNSVSSISIGDDSVLDHLSWEGDSSCKLFSLREAWHLLRSKAIEPPWSALVLSKFSTPPPTPGLSCLS